MKNTHVYYSLFVNGPIKLKHWIRSPLHIKPGHKKKFPGNKRSVEIKEKKRGRVATRALSLKNLKKRKEKKREKFDILILKSLLEENWKRTRRGIWSIREQRKKNQTRCYWVSLQLLRFGLDFGFSVDTPSSSSSYFLEYFFPVTFCCNVRRGGVDFWNRLRRSWWRGRLRLGEYFFYFWGLFGCWEM